MSALGDATEAIVESPSATEIAKAEATPSRSLYRVFWRWHFYAGLLVTPVLLIVTITGALYIFKDEIEGLLYPSILFVEPGSSRVPLEDQIAAAQATLPEGYRAGSLAIFSDVDRATEVFAQARNQPFKQVYVDPYTGKVLGELSGDRFFRTVLKLHRSLFLGVTGRVLVELMTGWTIILLITGVYLWWPRKRSVAGVLIPRLKAKPYVVLRDLHTIAGFYLFPLMLLICLTGLVYTQVWGSGYQLTAKKVEPSAPKSTPKSSLSGDAKPIPLEVAFAQVRERYPNAAVLSASIPSKTDGSLMFFASGQSGPLLQGKMTIDRSSGEVLADEPVSEKLAPSWWLNWNYPLHVGSVLGMLSKILWLIACLVLIALPITGLWMWWKRRPKGRTGFPRRPSVRVRWGVIGSIVLLGFFMPVVGISMLAILLGEWIVPLLWRRSPAMDLSK